MSGAATALDSVRNNFLKHGEPEKFAEKLKACGGDAGCEQNVRKDMAQESANNIAELKGCWESGDIACVNNLRGQIALGDDGYTQLRVADDMAGRAYENSAKWYADIIENCAGKCGWLEASLLKTGADGLGNAAYAALGMGSLPKPGTSASAAVEAEGSAAKGTTGAVNTALLDELTTNGVKFTPENVLATARTPSGQIVFLETGNARAGLQHIVGEHVKDFANIGVTEAQIPKVVMQAVAEGKIVGYQGAGTGRPIYETIIDGKTQRLAITVSNNGFVVGANPAGSIK